jgi:hypothetical protein
MCGASSQRHPAPDFVCCDLALSTSLIVLQEFTDFSPSKLAFPAQLCYELFMEYSSTKHVVETQTHSLSNKQKLSGEQHV